MDLRRMALPLGVSLLSGGVLMVELLLTRLFSVALYYHFAFLAVSVALMGLGVGGLLVYINRERFTPERLPTQLNTLGLATTLSMVAVVVVILSLRLPTQISLATAARLGGVFLISAVPFVFGGAMLSLLVRHFSATIHRVYFYDLVGASLGSLFVLPALGWIGAPNALLAATAFVATGTALLGVTLGAARKRIVFAGVTAAAVLLVISLNLDGKILDLRFAKGSSTAVETYARWNAISRVCIHPRTTGYAIQIDCDAATGVARWDFWNGDRAAITEAFSHMADDLPHLLRPRAKTLVIGSGGGIDVARALAHGSPRVVAVEINPLIARDVMLGTMRQESYRLFERPEVELVVDDARSAIGRSNEAFDVIQATGIDTWASTAAGAFALSESYLYTVEAFQTYLGRLSPDGILTVTRWEFDPPRQALRIASIARAALEQMKIDNPERNIMAVRNARGDVVVMVKRSAFTNADAEKVRAFIAAHPNVRAMYLPDRPEANAYQELLHAPSLTDFAAGYPYDVSPTPDARPFFFFTTRWSGIIRLFSSSPEDLKNNLALFVLAVMVGFTGLGVVLLISLPRWMHRGESHVQVPGAHWTYFLTIGIAYIIVEIAMIQTFVLLMGHPTYGMTVVVFSLLVGSGLGSRWSGRLRSPAKACLVVPIVLTLALCIAHLLVYPSVLALTQSLSRLARGVISVALIFPLGFVMGMPFPSGIRAAGRLNNDVVPWLWSANAAGSVFGSVLAIVLAVQFGVPNTGAVGALLYLMAAAMGYLILKSAALESRASEVAVERPRVASSVTI